MAQGSTGSTGSLEGQCRKTPNFFKLVLECLGLLCCNSVVTLVSMLNEVKKDRVCNRKGTMKFIGFLSISPMATFELVHGWLAAGPAS